MGRSEGAAGDLIVHVGLHKTGTTSIQRALLDQRETLLRAGVYVPRSGARPNKPGHHDLARELDDASSSSAGCGIVGRLTDELRAVTHAKAVISSEDFSRIDRSGRKYARLKRIADDVGRRLIVLAFVREHVSNINSSYVQQIKSFAHDLEFADYLVRERTNPRWSYRTVLSPFEDAGAEMLVKAYEGDTTASFFEAMGVDAQGGAERANQTLGPLTVEAYRSISRHLRSIAPAFAALRTKKKRVKATGIRDVADRLGWNRERYWGFQPEEAAELHRALYGGDKEFLERHGVVFAPPAGRAANDVSYPDMAEAERNEFAWGVGRMVIDAGDAEGRRGG